MPILKKEQSQNLFITVKKIDKIAINRNFVIIINLLATSAEFMTKTYANDVYRMCRE